MELEIITPASNKGVVNWSEGVAYMVPREGESRRGGGGLISDLVRQGNKGLWVGWLVGARRVQKFHHV